MTAGERHFDRMAGLRLALARSHAKAPFSSGGVANGAAIGGLVGATVGTVFGLQNNQK